MYDWNLYILFGVGGGFFVFFSSCFCYHKRKDVLRRREEKEYENERDDLFTQIYADPPDPLRASSKSQSAAGHSQANQDIVGDKIQVSRGQSSKTVTTVVQMELQSSSASGASPPDEPLPSTSSSHYHPNQSQDNEAFETTEL